MNRSPNRNRPAARPQRPSPPSAATPHGAICASARETSPSGGMPSLSTSSWDAPSLPLGRELLLPGLLFLAPTAARPWVEAQLPGRHIQTHLVDQFSVHRGVAEQHLQREAVHERREVRREALGVAGSELARALALPYHLGYGVAPPAFERLALAGRLVVAQGTRP